MESTESMLEMLNQADSKIKEQQRKELLTELETERRISLEVPSAFEIPEALNFLAEQKKEPLQQYLEENMQTIMQQIFPNKSYIFKTFNIDSFDPYFSNLNTLLHYSLL